MKKAIIISLVLLTGIPLSCDVTGGNDSDFFRIESFALAVGTFFKSDDLTSFREREFYLPPRDTLSSFDLAVEIGVDEFSFIASAAPFSLIASTFAEPIPPRAESKLSLISIYTKLPVFAGGIEYKQGDNLANLFSISTAYRETSTILKFIQEEHEWYIHNNLYLTLNSQLDEPLSQTLLIDITLENGTVFNLESAHIVIK